MDKYNYLYSNFALPFYTLTLQASLKRGYNIYFIVFFTLCNDIKQKKEVC